MISNDFKYKYECPLHINGLGTIYPYSTILDTKKRREIYWEHFGMMDNEDYAEKAIYRINCYIKAGYIIGQNLICTYETD